MVVRLRQCYGGQGFLLRSRGVAYARTLQIPLCCGGGISPSEPGCCVHSHPSNPFMLRGWDLNPRPGGYEPPELPDCSTPLRFNCSLPQPDFQYFSLLRATNRFAHLSMIFTERISLFFVDCVFPLRCSDNLLCRLLVIPTYIIPFLQYNA